MAEEPKKTWQWVTVDEYEKPAVPTVIKVKKWWGKFIRWITPEQEQESEDDQSSALELSFDDAADALEQCFSDWLEDDEDNSLRWIIAPPHSGVEEAVKKWAEKHSLREMNLPDREPLCDPGDSTLPEFLSKSDDNKPWIMPQLAHSFLRQTNGLRWVREFFSTVLSGEAGKGVIVCDSWAWAFLEKVWPVPVSQLWTLQGLDQRALEELGLARGDGRLRALAALSRGNAGVAAAYSDRYQRSSEKPFETPSMPSEINDATAFVCYALLLHRGLNKGQLVKVLPIVSGSQLEIQLQVLHQRGLIELEQELWYVTARGYPVVRELLASRGFWLDRF
ncbi:MULTISPECIES: hypothetical protein [Idiomarina]|jgi:hypothetical protein|uniref:hypothetical protein n=1 Tax=Idiomarina TaxID=135575 RepID=UPI000C65C5C0|nr:MULTISPECIES: hypothetical protein [Idiomarina]MAO67119.1 hypothetical protein [Idiomarina sp.]MBF80241.1 hypothetical protein [Idiomarina sp.]|tara:strand:+ start:8564 stop:9568 length:1005 start_codon:yes stop_codon:yes gene_type:complete